MEIIHWKEIETPEGLRPVLFFNPTLSFLTYLNNYGYHNIPVRVVDSIFYDGLYVTDVEVTTQMPGERQYYSIVLNRDFTLMPVQKGTLILSENTQHQHNNTNKQYQHNETDAQQHNKNVQHPHNMKSGYEHTPQYDPILTEHNDDTTNTNNYYPTTTPTKTCTNKSLDLWQIFLIILALIIIMVCCFYPFLI